ncbi:MAG: dTMP kinase [Chlorobi bacterium]|nr:dTMP kinase [Chlorobiota bacterium]
MFITFEGIDCSGKSTQAQLLANKLQEANHNIVELREPGNTRLSEHIRGILLNKEYSEINERTELLLFSASRAQLVAEVILPSLHKGKIVICDRFSDSTIAYQGYGRGLPLNDIVHINRIATQETEPDMTFYLDISPETALERTDGREGIVQDRMEEAGITFFKRVIRGYMRIANMNSGRYYVIDGGKSVDEIHSIIWRLVSERLSEEERYSTSRNGALEPMIP